MPIPIFTQLGPDPQYNDLVNKINTLVNELTNLMLSLDTLNVVSLNAEVIEAGTITADKIGAGEITANEIAANTITADKMNVTELSAIVANLGTITAGLLQAVTITGSLIQTDTAGNYPRIEMSSSSNLLRAYANATEFIRIQPQDGSIHPRFSFINGSDVQGFLTAVDSTTFLISTVVGEGNIQISSGEDLELRAIGNVNVANWSEFVNDNTNQTLQEALNDKEDNISGHTGSIETVDSLGVVSNLNFSNGILTSVT